MGSLPNTKKSIIKIPKYLPSQHPDITQLLILFIFDSKGFIYLVTNYLLEFNLL